MSRKHGKAVTEEGKDENRYELEGGLDVIDVSYAMGDGESILSQRVS